MSNRYEGAGGRLIYVLVHMHNIPTRTYLTYIIYETYGRNANLGADTVVYQTCVTSAAFDYRKAAPTTAIGNPVKASGRHSIDS